MYIYVPEDVELVFQAMEMLINEGDNVAVECPTYSGALAIVSHTLSALVTRYSYARKPFCGFILVILCCHAFQSHDVTAPPSWV